MPGLAEAIINFFLDRMREHSCVKACVRLPIQDSDEVVFEIERKNDPPIKVHLSDAYSYGEGEYLARPRQIRRGDFILITKPEARFDRSLIARARRDGIGIGQIRKFMGALNSTDVSQFVPQEERAKSRNI